MLLAVQQRRLYIGQDLPIVKFDPAPGYTYFGQTPTLNGNFVGRKEYENGIIEGLFAFDRDDPAGMLLNGFGRAFSA